MRIAVVQHRLRDTPEEDARALGAAAGVASKRGAELVVMPEVFSLGDHGSASRELLYGLLDEIPDGQRLLPHIGADKPGLAFTSDPLPGLEALGRPAIVIGDSCLVGAEWIGVLGSAPDLVVLAPRSENDLQAEAALELAIGLSESVCGLVLVCEPTGAEPGDPGHGGSAIIFLGEVLGEATGGDDVLFADLELPLAKPEPREPLPDIPPILKQRLAHHQGLKPEVDYPADLSDGAGPA